MEHTIYILIFLLSLQLSSALDDKTLQSSSLSNVILTSASSDQIYRITGYVVVTRAATTSASVTTTLTYTDADRNALTTITLLGFNSGGTVGTTPANSTTSTGVLCIIAIIRAKAGTNISYSTTYASSGATTMQYSIHMREEVL